MKNTILLLAVGLLFISNLVIGTLYLLEKGSDANIVAANSNVGNTTDLLAQTDNSNLAKQQPEQKPSDNVIYKSAIGHFSLELDNEYEIAVSQDSGADSNKLTKLQVGRRIFDKNGVISLGLDDYTKVEAYPSKFNGNRDQFVTADTALQSANFIESSQLIDGVKSRKFIIDGVGKTVKYYFERNGMTYLIEAWDTSSGDTSVMLNDVVKGFNFN